ncbi:hypothetical protein PV325_000596 [Microctonus aethiopoides]|nr:hypothetical protein PV325_000596 [Microctonus aethiopoides]
MLSFSGLLFVCIKSYQFEVIVVLLISYILSILAIVGTFKEDARFIFPFLSAYFSSAILEFPYYFIQMIQNAVKISAPGWIYPLICVIGIIGLGIGVYFFAIIYSFYQELLRKKSSPSNTDNVDSRTSDTKKGELYY